MTPTSPPPSPSGRPSGSPDTPRSHGSGATGSPGGSSQNGAPGRLPGLDPRQAGESGDPVEMTRVLVSIPSVNPDLSEGAAGEADVTRVCEDWLRSWGFRVEVVETTPGRPSLVARLGEGRPRTILNGHTDTVGVEGMTIAPFEPRVENGELLGRGSCDMKAGLAAILAAARRLATGNDPFPGELIVVFTADEEFASIGLRDLLDRGLEADRAVVTEPTSLALCTANRGFTWIHVEVEGRAAHGSRPDLGRDAIRGAGRILAELDGFEAEVQADHPLLAPTSIHAGTIKGGTAPPVYPAHCEMVLEARTLPGQTPDAVVEGVRAAVERARSADPDLSARVRAGLSRPASELDGDHPLVADLGAALRGEGREPSLAGMSAWVESAWFNEAGIPALCFGPGAIDRAHTADEAVPVEEIRVAARVLERFVRGGVLPGDGFGG